MQRQHRSPEGRRDKPLPVSSSRERRIGRAKRQGAQKAEGDQRSRGFARRVKWAERRNLGDRRPLRSASVRVSAADLQKEVGLSGVLRQMRKRKKTDGRRPHCTDRPAKDRPIEEEASFIYFFDWFGEQGFLSFITFAVYTIEGASFESRYPKRIPQKKTRTAWCPICRQRRLH